MLPAAATQPIWTVTGWFRSKSLALVRTKFKNSASWCTYNCLQHQNLSINIGICIISAHGTRCHRAAAVCTNCAVFAGRYGNDDQYLSTVIRYDLEFLDMCPCMVDVEIIDAKNGQVRICFPHIPRSFWSKGRGSLPGVNFQSVDIVAFVHYRIVLRFHVCCNVQNWHASCARRDPSWYLRIQKCATAALQAVVSCLAVPTTVTLSTSAPCSDPHCPCRPLSPVAAVISVYLMFPKVHRRLVSL